MDEWLSIDFETRSDIDLTKTGVYRYVESPHTAVTRMGYAFDYEPVQLWRKHEPPPARVFEHVRQGGKVRADAPMVVLGPGTGFGAAAFIPRGRASFGTETLCPVGSGGRAYRDSISERDRLWSNRKTISRPVRGGCGKRPRRDERPTVPHRAPGILRLSRHGWDSGRPGTGSGERHREARRIWSSGSSRSGSLRPAGKRGASRTRLRFQNPHNL